MKKYPVAYLSNLKLVQRGDYRALIAKSADGHPEMLGFVWMDQDCHYFVVNASSLE